MSDITDVRLVRSLTARRRGFRFARTGYRALQRVTVPLRRAYYVEGRGRAAIASLPAGLRDLLGLDDETAIGSTRLEIGGGPHAQPGFLHVDIDPGARHLEWVAPGWDLPVPSGWVTELVAVHALEHIPPPRLIATLTEWRRVLAPGGRVRVHVPNGPALMEAFIARPVDEKWPIMGSILGMYCSPEVREPDGLRLRSDHQLIFDRPLLSWAFESTGFVDVTDLTDSIEDRHTAPWRGLVPAYSLIAEARKPL